MGFGATGATIFARASGPGRAGVAVIRVSGPDAVRAAREIAGGPPPPRRAVRRRLRRPADGETLDHGLILWFPAPHSYTGEDVLELQVHGGRAVVEAILGALGGLPGFRLAAPGEFTRRAFLNGQMDLTSAEAVADLTAAETAVQRRQALEQLDGALARLYQGWRLQVIETLAVIEAGIDFCDQELPDGLDARAEGVLTELTAGMRGHLESGHRGERLREGIAVAIIGATNAGKSSLMNALARREVAIVSPVAGTTRDLIEVPLDLGGYPVVLIDTAGLREGGCPGAGASPASSQPHAADEIEREGIRRARARAREADFRIAVFDLADWPQQDTATAALVDPDTLVVHSKADLWPAQAAAAADAGGLVLSTVTGRGLDSLVMRLIAAVGGRYAEQGSGSPAPTRARHRITVAAALREIEAALGPPGAPPLAAELLAEHLRAAGAHLARLTGAIDVEDVLDQIFRDFCIGK